MLFKHLTAVVTTLALITPYVTAHMAMLYPWPRGYRNGVMEPEVHAWIGFSPKRTLPCNGFGPGRVTRLEAGQVVKVCLLWQLIVLPLQYFEIAAMISNN